MVVDVLDDLILSHVNSGRAVVSDLKLASVEGDILISLRYGVSAVNKAILS